MRKVILDTDILSEVFKQQDPTVLANATRYLSFHSKLSYASVTVVEILSGLRARDAKSQLAKAEDFLTRHEELVPDSEDYRLSAEIIGTLVAMGRPIGWDDPLIAACAIRRELPLISGNAKHYEYVRQAGFRLELDDWRSR